MSKRTFAAGALVVAVLLAAGGLFASNMGFKLNFALDGPGAGVSANGTNALALPFNRQAGIDTAKALIDDIGSSIVTNVQRLIESNNGLQIATDAATSFPLSTGEGYFVRMASSTNYIVVGSHDPAAGVSLDGPSAGVSANGSNFYAYAYHSTAGTAKELIDDIGSPITVNVQKLIKSNNGLQVATDAATSYPLVPGEAYIVRMSSSTSYVPSHF